MGLISVLISSNVFSLSMNNAELWETVLGELQLLVSKPTFSTFFTQTRLENFTNGVATIACNSGVAATLMEGR